MLNFAARERVRLVLLLSMLPTVASAEPLLNADVSDGLNGWVTDASQADVVGTIQVAGGRAILDEQGSFLTALRQTFVVPAGSTELSFELETLPGFDTVEVRLRLGDGEVAPAGVVGEGLVSHSC